MNILHPPLGNCSLSVEEISNTELHDKYSFQHVDKDFRCDALLVLKQSDLEFRRKCLLFPLASFPHFRWGKRKNYVLVNDYEETRSKPIKKPLGKPGLQTLPGNYSFCDLGQGRVG